VSSNVENSQNYAWLFGFVNKAK